MSQDFLANFKVDQLKPQSSGANPGSVYQLTADSVSPVRTVGRDKWGAPVEETVPACCGVRWVHPCGAVNNVPMMTSPVGWGIHDGQYVGDNGHTNYANNLTRDLIRDGHIPLTECPYTQRWFSVTRTLCLVDNPDKIEDCGGKPEGCDHLKAVMLGRAAMAKAKHEHEHAAYEAMKPVDVRGLMTTMIAGMQDAADARAATGPQPPTSNAKRRLVDGKSDSHE